MKKLKFIKIMAVLVALNLCFVSCGVVTYEEGSCEGYTLFGIITPNDQRGILIDMNGHILKEWSVFGFPAKMIPGGSIIAGRGVRQEPGYDDSLVFFGESIELVQMDWNGNIVWRFDNWSDDGTGRIMARQHHDFQIEGNPIGYYAPARNLSMREKF